MKTDKTPEEPTPNDIPTAQVVAVAASGIALGAVLTTALIRHKRMKEDMMTASVNKKHHHLVPNAMEKFEQDFLADATNMKFHRN